MVMSKSEEKLVLTVEETAEYLGLCRNGAYDAVQRGDIPHIRIGRRILVPRAALERMLAEAGHVNKVGGIVRCVPKIAQAHP
jgi:excisionase family DNA binding protein